ncbi:RimL Acetyltransferases, including N-acetylases of ribosomal proteins [Candidatus Nanopelagicaceae bacterium]
MELRRGDLQLVPFQSKDISHEYLNWLNDASHMRFSNQRHFRHSKESSLEYLNSFEGTSNLFLGVFNNKDGLVGTVTIYRDLFNDWANIGILISPEMNRRGIATNVFSLLLEELPGMFALHKISSGTCELNLGMISVLQKSGMFLEYRMPQELKIEGKYVDCMIFSKYF